MPDKPHWIFLSPHLDDVVFSCGGLIWELTQRGERVEVWTIFAGDPPDAPLSTFAQKLHARWKTSAGAVQTRREEDTAACAILGASFRHFYLPDCIYRLDDDGEAVIRDEADLFRPGYGGEARLAEQLRRIFEQELSEAARLAVPFTIGEHIDHQLVRRVAGNLRRVLWYYAEYPYSAVDSTEFLLWQQCPVDSDLPVITRQALEKWQTAAACYQSQISTFWSDIAALRNAFEKYWRQGRGTLRISPFIPF